MKSLQNQYIEITEGKGHKDMFMKSARKLFPQYITNFAPYKEVVTILKQKGILSENIGGVVSKSAFNPFQAFNTFVNEEAKAVEKKPTKAVIEKETAGFDYKNRDNIDNVYGTSFLQGFYAEMQDPKNAEKSVDDLKEIVTKNMAKDFNYYMKNAAFGIKGLGYQTSKEPKAPTGKYKSSGYGNLKENKSGVRKSYDQEIDLIKYEVDYVPDEIEVYKSWPEPYRSKALKALEYRKANFKQMSKDKLDTFKESLNTENIQFKKGDKVKYLDYTGEIAGVHTDTSGRTYYTVSYTSKNGKRRIAQGIYNKGGEIKSLKESKLRSIINAIIKEELNEIGMFHDPIGYEKGSKSRREVARDILKDAGLSQEEIDTFISDNMFKKGRIDDLAKALVSKNKMNEGYGMSLEDAKAKAKHISKEEGVVQHVEETEEGSGEYRVSDWYDSDLTVVSYENGMEK